MFLDCTQAKVLQYRQYVGQRHRGPAVIELQADCRISGLDRAMQVDRQRHLVGQTLQLSEVEQRHGGVKVLAIGRVEGVGKGALLGIRLFLAACRAQGIVQVVFPGTGGAHQASLDRLNVGLERLAGWRRHRDQDTRQHVVADLRRPARYLAVERRGQNGLELAAQLGRKTFARRVDQARNEALEFVAPDELADARPLLQRHDLAGDAVQFVLGNLEQLVARIGVENVLQRLAVMA